MAAERARAAGSPAPIVASATQVLVAKRDLALGQFVRAEDLRWQPWPDDNLAPSYVVQGRRTMEEFVGGVVRQPIVAGEPITEMRVVSPGNSGFLAAVLTPGHRAVSVPVTLTSVISGFVFPGDRVDVILSHTVQNQDERDVRVSSTMLRDIRVLALDQKTAMQPGETSPGARTATLEVTPKQSEIIAVAAEMGKLSLSLRSLARVSPAHKPEPAWPTYTLETEVGARAATRRVTVFRGGKAEDVNVPRVSR
jgi:pilus assembly protein CpaB